MGCAPSSTTVRLAPADRPAWLPDRSNAAPAAASSFRDALADIAVSRRAFWEGARVTTIVSLTAAMADAPASGIRSAAPAATANAPASSPSGGPATYSSYATVRRPVPKSRTARLASSRGGALSGVTAMRAPDTALDGWKRAANPAGRSSSAAGPAATAPAFWAAVSLTITVSLKPSVPPCATGVSAPSRPTTTSPLGLRIDASVRFVSDRITVWSNWISRTPVLRSSRTGDGTAASTGVPNPKCWLNGCRGPLSSPTPSAGGGRPFRPAASAPTGDCCSPRAAAAANGSAAALLWAGPGPGPTLSSLPPPPPPPPSLVLRPSELSKPTNGLPDTSYTAVPDTLRYTGPVPPIAAWSTYRPWSGVMVTTSLPPYDSPSGEDAAAPSRLVMARPPLWNKKPPPSTASRSMYSLNGSVSVLARRFIVTSPASTGGTLSSVTLRVRFCTAARPWPPASENTPPSMSMASPPLPSGSTYSAASRALCASVSSTTV